MKKRFPVLLAVCLLLALCAVCGGSETESLPPGAVVLRLANSHNADHITSQACQLFANLVRKRTDGRVTILCYFDGELGDERSTIEQCRFGGLDFTRVSSGASAEVAPLLNALQMPYEYTGEDHLFRVLDGEIGQEVLETFRDSGLVGLTYLHPGSRCFFNSQKEIRAPADMAGMRFRVSESDLMLGLMDCLGATGVGLPFNDTYSAIQTRTVDGAENNLTSYIEMSFWEVAPYWTRDSHSYMPDMLLASEKTMEKLSAEDQAVLFDCARTAALWHRDAWKASESRSAEIALEKGCILTTLATEELEAFQEAVAPLYDSFLDDEQKAVVERVRALG